MNESIILPAKGPDLWYGLIQALKGVSMDIPGKQVIALIDPSGCGKSTFLKTLDRMNDLVPSIKIIDLVQYRGQEIYAPNVDVAWLRKQIGMVFQEPNPFLMSIYDNVAYGPRTHDIKNRSRPDDTVEKSLQGAAIWDEVKDRFKKPVLGLSGGQQQRLCIARALAVEPDILLMDEATSAPDPISTSKIEDLTADLKQNYTIVIVTHNMQQVIRVSDKYAFLPLGQLIEFGDTIQLFFTPRGKRTEDHITGRFGQKGGLTRKTFDAEFQELNYEMVDMAVAAKDAIDVVIESLASGDDAAAKSTVEMTRSMDQMEWDIENRCLRLFLQQQPVTRDLCTISVAMKMVTGLQRISDQCANIAEIFLPLKEQKQTRTLADIRAMSQEADVMVKRSIFAYVNRDTRAAQAVTAPDDEVDVFFCTIKGELVELTAGNRDEADQVIDLIIIAKYLERIADHAMDTAQWAIFHVTGEILG